MYVGFVVWEKVMCEAGLHVQIENRCSGPKLQQQEGALHADNSQGGSCDEWAASRCHVGLE